LTSFNAWSDRRARLFSDDPSKEFETVEEKANAVLSLDVIYHLVEDHVFMTNSDNGRG
jgi:hypothetical protein